MKVLICEEDSGKAKVIKDLLNVYNFKLITLTNSGDFFKQVQTHRPALIIFNENFSQKPGIDFINRLRTNPVTSKIPIIYISDKSDLEQSLSKYTNDSLIEWMQEPYKIKHLRHYIDRWTTFRSLYAKQ